MRMMYESELRPFVSKARDEILKFARELVDSNNATNWQKVGELSFLLRRSHKKSEAVEVAQMMYKKSSTVDKLNQYFVAVVDRADIAEVRALDQLVEEYLSCNNLGYQKHLFATWLKAANAILDDAMFDKVYGLVPSSEKTDNTYIISQYYVYLNRHSRYSEVRDHYDKLPPNIQNSQFVKKYYLNASERMGYLRNLDSEYKSTAANISNQGVQNTVIASNESGQKNKVFIVFGNEPDALNLLKALLNASGIPYSLLRDEGKVGDTIIASFERVANEAALALVLCTPEDEGKDGRWYPRQNVVFELGYFRAKLGANRACILRQTGGKNLTLPSDLDGVLFIDMDNTATFVTKLHTVLEQAGFTPTF